MKCIFCKLVPKIELAVHKTVLKFSEAVELVHDVSVLVKDVAHDFICHNDCGCCGVEACSVHEDVCECDCDHCKKDCCLDTKCCDDCHCC